MKNTVPDYTTQLHNDFIPREKTHYDYNRRRFNPGNPNEFEFKPAAIPQPVKEENIIASTVDDNGVDFNAAAAADIPAGNNIPSDEHIF